MDADLVANSTPRSVFGQLSANRWLSGRLRRAVPRPRAAAAPIANGDNGTVADTAPQCAF